MHRFRLSLEIWVELYSCQCAHELLFIPILFLICSINVNIILENADTIRNIRTIQTDTIHYVYRHQFFLFSKLLPMKVK